MSVWHPVLLSLQVAATATLVVALTGIALAWYLSERRGAFADTIASVVALPLVLPPTVIGFGLLWALQAGQAPAGRVA